MDMQNFSTGVIVSALVGGLSLVHAQEPYSAAPPYQRRTIDEQTLNVYRDELLLDQEKLLFKIRQDRFERDRKHDEILHAAYIIKSIAELDINDSEYQLKRAKILSEHAEGLDLAKDFIKTKDDLWAAQQKANNRTAAATLTVGQQQPANIATARATGTVVPTISATAAPTTSGRVAPMTADEFLQQIGVMPRAGQPAAAHETATPHK